jgi:hypothetical protein
MRSSFLLRVGVPVGDDDAAVRVGRGERQEGQGVERGAPEIGVDAERPVFFGPMSALEAVDVFAVLDPKIEQPETPTEGGGDEGRSGHAENITIVNSVARRDVAPPEAQAAASLASSAIPQARAVAVSLVLRPPHIDRALN